ncbi:hypothetical protein [Jannaschia ovalis]|uniref:Excalibur calcium-binding domain-containing protein n=1 Tax=Jannaschia ovalis TaxID=3038773 RepID=A0ABY8LB29_9RHOB|nr:hypothetical protein [Jannaschia sp. GRR-S6-38]WGH77822.1 hypothetical protein P8627_12365 [Jannaschia sp. GRR-S6-38]
MRIPSLIGAGLALTLLAACEPPVPESAPRGAGFETPAQYAARREAMLRGTPAPLRPEQTVLPPTTPPASEAQQIASATRAVLQPGTAPARPPASQPISIAPAQVPPAQVAAAAPAPLPPAATAPAGTSAPLDLDRDNPNISREQDFAAVSAARSIEDDAARVRAARQQYQIVRPTQLQRPEDGRPNIVAYAINQAQPVGTRAFSRNPLSSARRAEARCQGYRTADIAQEDFLAAGGPERDRLGLDPDGDGNACGWDPATFRALVQN